MGNAISEPEKGKDYPGEISRLMLRYNGFKGFNKELFRVRSCANNLFKPQNIKDFE